MTLHVPAPPDMAALRRLGLISPCECVPQRGDHDYGISGPVGCGACNGTGEAPNWTAIMAVLDSPMASLLAELREEIERQDRLHPKGFPANRDGIRLAIAVASEDELADEAYGAWRQGRCRCVTPMCDHADWTDTAEEMLQAATVIMRAVRSIRNRAAARAVGDARRFFLRWPGTSEPAWTEVGSTEYVAAQNHAGVPASKDPLDRKHFGGNGVEGLMVQVGEPIPR